MSHITSTSVCMSQGPTVVLYTSDKSVKEVATKCSSPEKRFTSLYTMMQRLSQEMYTYIYSAVGE